MINKLIAIVSISLLLIVSFTPLTQSAFAQQSNSNSINSMANEFSSSMASYNIESPPIIVLESFQKVLSTVGNYSLGNASFIQSNGKAFIITSPHMTIVGRNSTNKMLILKDGNYSDGIILGKNDGSRYNMTIGPLNVSLLMGDNNILGAVNALAYYILFSSASTQISSSDYTPDSILPPGEYAWGHTLSASVYTGWFDRNGTPYQSSQLLFWFSVNVGIIYTDTSLVSGSITIYLQWLREINFGFGTYSDFYRNNIFYVYDNKSLDYGMYPIWYVTSNTYGYNNDTTLNYLNQHVTLYAEGTENWGVDTFMWVYIHTEQSVNIPQLTT